MSTIDADFDSYWEEEARNPNRNRIRIGRQYQATVPPLLKQGESDGRKLEELETLRWRPDNELTGEQLDQYLSVAKAVSLFTRAIDNNYSQNSVNSVNNDSHIETDETTETNNNSNQNNNSDLESDNKCDKDNDKDNSSSTSAVKDNRIQCALKGLSEFVSSHHPIHRDIGCRTSSIPETATYSAESESTNSLTSLLSAEWNANETKLFSRALEVCGKNFGAIKKDFLPWKSVKSIIEHYYLGLERERERDKHDQHNDTNQSDPKHVTIKQEPGTNTISSVSKFMGSSSDSKPESNDCQRTQSSQMSSSDENNECDVKKVSDDDSKGVSGQEVKPLKAKPILPSAIQESSSSVSTVGSLKFFLDGQLVLKLNAQQSENTSQKCQWVESSDIVKKARLMQRNRKRLLNDRHDLDVNNHLNNKTLSNDDLDDGSNDSSDDESLESNESALAPSPSAMVAKKAKVKLENNSYKSLSSPTSVSAKDPKLDISNPCNRIDRNIKVECVNSVKRERLSPLLNSDDDIRRKLSSEVPNERPNSQNCLENKWYHTIVEKSSLHPPKAHSVTSGVPSHRHSRYESVQSSLGTSSTTSSPSSSSSSTSGAPVPSMSSNAIPVDLTRKSTNYSPFETKSSLSSSSTLDFVNYSERDKNSKVLSSPSPPRPPFVFPHPAYPLSPTQSQTKIKREKEVKSSSNLCQKTVEGRPVVKSSPPTSPSSAPSSTPPLTYPSAGQMAWLQNSFANYLPIYEQYYRYYYGYGMPAPSHPQYPIAEMQRFPLNNQTSRENEPNNKDRAKCLTDGVLADGDDTSCGS